MTSETGASPTPAVCDVARALLIRRAHGAYLLLMNDEVYVGRRSAPGTST